MAKVKTPRTTTTRSKKNGSNGEAAATPAVTATPQTPVVEARESAPRPEARAEVKEARKAVPEGRRNLVPMNLEEEIRRRAYQLYEERGCTPGHENDDWLVAEREVLARYVGQQHSA